MPSPTIYSFTITDASGKTKATSIYYVAYDAATETVGALVGNIAALGGLIDPVTGGVITDCRITIDVAPDPSWKTTPIAGSDAEKTLVMNFDQANSKYAQELIVPAIRDTLLDANGRPIVATGAIATLVSNLTNQTTGIGGSTTVFGNSKYSNALQRLRDAFISFRKRGSAVFTKVTP